MKLQELQGVIDSDCREEVGITVGLIDGLIAQVRILRDRDLSSNNVQEAFLDLADDEDFKWLCAKVQEKEEEETISQDPEDVVSMDVAFFIRLLELVRENVKDDATLHRLADKVIEKSRDGYKVTMDNYEEIEDTEGVHMEEY